MIKNGDFMIICVAFGIFFSLSLFFMLNLRIATGTDLDLVYHLLPRYNYAIDPGESDFVLGLWG